MRHKEPDAIAPLYSGAEVIYNTGRPSVPSTHCIDYTSTIHAERLDTIMRDALAGGVNIQKPPHYNAEDAHIMRWAFAFLCESQIGRSMVIAARQAGWSVGFDDDEYEGSDLDFSARCLYIPRGPVTAKTSTNTSQYYFGMLVNLTHGLREIWHETQGHVLPQDLCPEDLIKKERILEADRVCSAIGVLWELREKHHYDMWRHALSSPLSDVAESFMNILKGDNRNNIPLAWAYGFHQWYAGTNRMSEVDRLTLEAMDYCLNQSQHRNPFGGQKLQPNTIERMMRVPSGACYLQGLGVSILQDPYYMQFSDPINEAHLFHILKDIESVHVESVSFRDADLARRIFPDAPIKKY